MSHRFIFALLPALLAVLSACARDSEAELRARLDGWFHLEKTLYFESRMRCTAAVFKLVEIIPRATLPVQRRPEDAKSAFRIAGRAALAMADFSPNDLIDALLLAGDGRLGKEALAAGAQAGPCFEGSGAGKALRRALTQAGATIAYDRGLEGLMVLDPEQGRLFFLAGDVW